MARNTGRFTRHQGFLTLWALFFLASVSLLLSVVSVGLAARRETTNQLTRDYAQATRVIERQMKRHVKKRPAQRQEKPAKQD